MPYIEEGSIESDRDLDPTEQDRVAMYYIKMDRDVPELFEHLSLVVEAFRHIIRGSYKRGIAWLDADYFSDFSDSKDSNDSALEISVEEERGHRFMGIVNSQVVRPESAKVGRIKSAKIGRKDEVMFEATGPFLAPPLVLYNTTPEIPWVPRFDKFETQRSPDEHVMVETKVRPGVKKAGLTDKRQEMKLMENNLQSIFGPAPEEPYEEVFGDEDFDLDQLNMSNSGF
jgi:hypothetical protein